MASLNDKIKRDKNKFFIKQFDKITNGRQIIQTALKLFNTNIFDRFGIDDNSTNFIVVPIGLPTALEEPNQASKSEKKKSKSKTENQSKSKSKTKHQSEKSNKKDRDKTKNDKSTKITKSKTKSTSTGNPSDKNKSCNSSNTNSACITSVESSHMHYNDQHTSAIDNFDNSAKVSCPSISSGVDNVGNKAGDLSNYNYNSNTHSYSSLDDRNDCLDSQDEMSEPPIKKRRLNGNSNNSKKSELMSHNVITGNDGSQDEMNNLDAASVAKICKVLKIMDKQQYHLKSIISPTIITATYVKYFCFVFFSLHMRVQL